MGKRSMPHSKNASAIVTNPISRANANGEETLVIDARAELRPAEIVERKLVTLLRGVSVPVSHVSAAFRTR
jgi:hypothetical protein